MNKLIAGAVAEKRNLLEPEALELFAAYGVAVPRHVFCDCIEGAVAAGEEIGYPVAAKIVSRDIVHKSEAGGVSLNLNSAEEVAAACLKMLESAEEAAAGARISGFLVSEMLRPGLECIAGMVRDVSFGPALMCGLGGVFVEVLRDVSFRVPPISKEDAIAMIYELKGAPLLKGARGGAAKDAGALAELLLRLGDIALENPEIQEMEINPCFVYENGLAIADARVML